MKDGLRSQDLLRIVNEHIIANSLIENFGTAICGSGRITGKQEETRLGKSKSAAHG